VSTSKSASRHSLTLVNRPGDDEEEEQFKPLEWGLIRRLFTYTKPVKRKLAWLVGLSAMRSAQLPALTWMVGLLISGPIARHDPALLIWGLVGYAALAVLTDGMFHFRQRFALEIGETVVSGLRAEIFAKVQRQPMSFFHRVKLGRIIGRVTSDVESLRVGIQDVLFVSVIQGGQMIFAAAVMAWCDWVLFLVVVAMAAGLLGVSRHVRVRPRHASAGAGSARECRGAPREPRATRRAGARGHRALASKLHGRPPLRARSSRERRSPRGSNLPCGHLGLARWQSQAAVHRRPTAKDHRGDSHRHGPLWRDLPRGRQGHHRLTTRCRRLACAALPAGSVGYGPRRHAG